MLIVENPNLNNAKCQIKIKMEFLRVNTGIISNIIFLYMFNKLMDKTYLYQCCSSENLYWW